MGMRMFGPRVGIVLAGSVAKAVQQYQHFGPGVTTLHQTAVPKVSWSWFFAFIV